MEQLHLQNKISSNIPHIFITVLEKVLVLIVLSNDHLLDIRVIAYRVMAVEIMKKPINMNAKEAKAMLVIIE